MLKMKFDYNEKLCIYNIYAQFIYKNDYILYDY